MLRKGDASYYVETAAAHALGQTRSTKAFDVLSKVAMKRESQNDVIRTGALPGFTELKDERALPIALEWTRRGNSNPVRGAATIALGSSASSAIARRIRRVRPPRRAAAGRLVARADERRAALAELKDTKAVAELARVVDRDLDGRVIRAAREAIARLREGADKGDEVKKLRADLDKAVEDNRKLADRLDKLESRNGASPAKRSARKSTPSKRPRSIKTTKRSAAARTR